MPPTDAIFHQHHRPDVCEACGATEGFEYLGEQRWPQAVAEVMGISPLVTLWQCPACGTTITMDVAL